tara:strand:- start:4031 stop:4405 length:375 start_codon:yes stop_codon:yes gene_type:complete
MGVTYTLINQTRGERIDFAHVGACKARELVGNPVAAAITSWYLLQHSGDAIAFVGDTDGKWPFATGCIEDTYEYREVTDEVVAELLRVGVLADHGLSFVDEDEPDTIFIRDLRNAWMPDPPRGE